MRNYSFKRSMMIAMLICTLQVLEIVRILTGVKRKFESTNNVDREKATKAIACCISETKVQISQALVLGGTSLLVITFINKNFCISMVAQSLFISNGFLVQSIRCLKKIAVVTANLFRIQKLSLTAF